MTVLSVMAQESIWERREDRPSTSVKMAMSFRSLRSREGIPVSNSLIRLLVLILYYWEAQSRWGTVIAVVSVLGLILIALILETGDSESGRRPPRGMIVVSEDQMEDLKEPPEDVNPGEWDPESGSYTWEEDS